MKVKEQFCEKISQELAVFKALKLKTTKEDIFSSSFEVEMYVILYEVLVDQIDDLSEAFMKSLMDEPKGVLKTLYESWLLSKGDNFNQVENFIKEVA